MIFNNHKSITLKAIFIFLLAGLLLRLILAYTYGHASGDEDIYLRFAKNLVLGNGFSLSDPDSNAISPSAGGYLPGYPFFISIIWQFFGESVYAIIVTQTVLCMVAILWFFYRLKQAQIKTNLILVLILVFSPITIGWTRYVLTDSLTITMYILVFSEILFFFKTKKISSVVISFFLVCAIYIRPDSLLLIPPILLFIFFSSTKKESLKYIGIIVVIVGTLVTPWFIRDAALTGNIINFTQNTAGVDPYEMEPLYTKPGFNKWANTWIVSEYERADAYGFTHKKPFFHLNNFLNQEDRDIAISIIYNDGQYNPPLSRSQDELFHSLALKRQRNMDTLGKVSLFFNRSIGMLLNPGNSWGLPIELPLKFSRYNLLLKLKGGDFYGALEQSKDYIHLIIAKIALWAYRLSLIAVFLTFIARIAYNFFRNRSNCSLTWIDTVLTFVFTVFLIRLIFFVSIGGVEHRYMAPLIPLIEVSVLITIYHRFFLKKE